MTPTIIEKPTDQPATASQEPEAQPGKAIPLSEPETLENGSDGISRPPADKEPPEPPRRRDERPPRPPRWRRMLIWALLAVISGALFILASHEYLKAIEGEAAQ